MIASFVDRLTRYHKYNAGEEAKREIYQNETNKHVSGSV
jgi:hypothetical protein